jgi:lipoprotein signal peptidase
MWPDRKVVLPIRLLALVCLLVIADQVSKAVVRTILPPGGSIPLIDGVLRITFVPNFTGFSWWVPPLPAWVRVAFQVVLCFIVLAAFPVYLFYTHTRRHSIWADIGFVGVVASVSGHLLDDFLMPFTTDFIQVFDSPGANLADIYSYVAISALVVETICAFRGRRPQWKGFRHLLALEVRIWKEFVEFFLKYLGLPGWR